MMTEQLLEQRCLEWFGDKKWNTLHGPDILLEGDNPLRTGLRDAVLLPHAEAAFSALNPQLPHSCWEQVVTLVTKPESLDVVINNHNFHKMLLEGVPVTYKENDEVKLDRAFLIDFEMPENNNFTVVNQFEILGSKQKRIPDIVCFINGLPIAVIELKSPQYENVGWEEGFSQLQTYKDELQDLFIYNEALVASDGVHARIGSLTASFERFMPWRTVANEDDKPTFEWQMETVVRGFFDKELLLDYIRYFVLFENGNGSSPVKKIAAYHQFHAVREAVNATIVAAGGSAPLRSNIAKGGQKAGVFWHTQGSGKSISMCCYAGKLLQQKEMNNPTLVVVTDRNDLDGQLYATFCAAEDLLRQKPVQANDREELRKMLAERESGGIIFTTVQKFTTQNGEDAHPALNDRQNIVVISDEAHRSQYGMKAVLKGASYKYGYAKHLRDALPNASFIGFTGTPIAFDDKDTRATFGDYVSIYDIKDAVEDGATVPIYYESRRANLDLNYAEIDKLSEEVDEIVEDEDLAARESTKGKWSQLEKLVGAAPRLKQIAEDLVQHFETRNKSMEGKAMIVAMSREICVNLYDAIVALRPEWHSDEYMKGAIKVIMTGSAADKKSFQPHIHNKATKKELEKRFKDPSDPLKLVIVRDMWLTGFDAPCCHTMYVDKPMKGHNLMQAIARVNRVFKDKQGGLVVDYIGIASELKNALGTYAKANGKGDATVDTAEAFSLLMEHLDVARGMFAKSPHGKGFDYSEYATKGADLLMPAAEYIVSLKDGKTRFLDTVLAITKAYSLCATLEEAAPLHKEIAFLSALKSIIVKHTEVGGKRKVADKNSALKQILDNAVIAEGVDDVFALCNLDKPNIGLLSEEFLEDVRNMQHKNFAVELLERLLKNDIKARTKTNVIQEKKYADRLQETLRKYRNRSIESAQVIEELIAMAKEIRESAERLAELGLSSDEIAFYDALADNESAVRELGDQTLKTIATELTRNLRKSTTVDWQIKESVRAKLRILVKRILRKYKYPPDKQEEAVQLVLKQAEVLSNEWAA